MPRLIRFWDIGSGKFYRRPQAKKIKIRLTLIPSCHIGQLFVSCGVDIPIMAIYAYSTYLHIFLPSYRIYIDIDTGIFLLAAFCRDVGANLISNLSDNWRLLSQAMLSL